MSRTAWANAIRQGMLRLRGMPIEHDLRAYRRVLARIEAVDASFLSDADLDAAAARLRSRALGGEPLDSLLPEFYAQAREVCARVLRLRPFDVQVLAGVALHRGKVAEMATGEGKTLAAVLPAALNALTGRGVHVFTANHYLARRDADWMGPVYRRLGLSVAAVSQGMGRDDRRAAYAADVTYVTAKEAGFDFLRDQTMTDPAAVVQRPFHYVIVDEADFILIDEARVPLVIAGEAPAPPVPHEVVASAVRQLRPVTDFVVDEHGRNITLTDAGFRHAERLLACPPLHLPEQRTLLSGIHVALHALALLHRDRDYIVRGGRIDLVDEFTGRVAENRRWPHGIQPALEAKEGLEVRPEGRVQITEFQRQIIDAYATMMEGLGDEIAETFVRLRAENGRIDLDRAGLRGPTSTWTYLVNDNPLPSFALQLIATGNYGVALATIVLAIVYWPVTLAVVATTFVRRKLRRQQDG